MFAYLTAIAAIFVVGVASQLLGRAIARRQILPEPPDRQTDPAALIEHLKNTAGCTCDGALGLPTLASYYCQVHGEDVRKKYPDADAVRKAVSAPTNTEPPLNRDGQVVQTAVRREFKSFMEAMECENFDEGRTELVRTFCPADLTAAEVRMILEAYAFDEGRNDALYSIYRRILPHEVQPLALQLGSVYVFDETRAAARMLLRS